MDQHGFAHGAIQLPPIIQTTQDNRDSLLERHEVFAPKSQNSAESQAIANILFPDGVPATSAAGHPELDLGDLTTPSFRPRTRSRLVMATPFYNLN